MKKKVQIFWILAILNIATVCSQETFRVMFYNLLNFPLEDAVLGRIQDLETILTDYQPDLFMVCELNNELGANSIKELIQNQLNPDFEMAIFELNTSDDTIGDQNDLQNLVYFDSSKFILESQTIITTIFRDFNHYKFKLNTVEQNEEPLFLDVIVCHLKASSGTENQELRLQMVQDLTTYLNTLPANSRVLLAGDFNVYTSSEPAFQELIDISNNITFADPANRIGSWHNNSNYIDVFTQSTRTQTGMGGTTGGFDDRFDFIMTSQNLINDSDLGYVTDSYKAYGNNGNVDCLNQAINDFECSGSSYSFEIRDALHNFSDHLPVTLQLETNQTLLNIDSYFIENHFEIIGSNIVNNTLTIKLLNPYQINNRLYIYNTLGQLVDSFVIKASKSYTFPVNHYTNGVYYISYPNYSTKPLKFIKAN